MQKEIHDYMNKHLDLLVNQAKSYQPFLKNAFPGINLSDACFNLIVGNAFSVFLTQYAIRMRSPGEDDFIEFGKLAGQYRDKINEMFSK